MKVIDRNTALKINKLKSFDIFCKFYYIHPTQEKKILKEGEDAETPIFFNQIFGRKPDLRQPDLLFAPYQYQVLDWLRNKHNIHLCVRSHGPHSDYIGSFRYSCNIAYKNKLGAIISANRISDELFALKNYEEALEKGIVFCLENLVKII